MPVAVRMAAVGIVLGLVVVVPLAHAVRSQLFAMSPGDPLALGGSALGLLAAALAASLVPGRRALRIQPAQALRDE